MSFGNVLKLYNSFKGYPFGKAAFSLFFSVNAPYFLNLRAIVNDLKPGFGTGIFVVTVQCSL